MMICPKCKNKSMSLVSSAGFNSRTLEVFAVGKCECMEDPTIVYFPIDENKVYIKGEE